MSDADELSDIAPFVAVAQTLSFRAAAQRLGVTPAAISKAVARLEARLNVTLIHRTTRRVALSEEGRVYLGRCLIALEALRQGREALSAAKQEVTGTLTLSLPHVLGPTVTRALPALTHAHPTLRVRLRITDAESDLIEEGVDIALRIGPLRDSSLHSRRLGALPWALVASPAYLAERGRPTQIEALAAHDALLFRSPRGQLVPWFLREADALAAHAPRVVLEADHGALLLEGALAGLGVAQVFAFMAAPALASGQLIALLPQSQAPGLMLHALYLPGQHAVPRVGAALARLAQLFGGHSG